MRKLLRMGYELYLTERYRAGRHTLSSVSQSKDRYVAASLGVRGGTT